MLASKVAFGPGIWPLVTQVAVNTRKRFPSQTPAFGQPRGNRGLRYRRENSEVLSESTTVTTLSVSCHGLQVIQRQK